MSLSAMREVFALVESKTTWNALGAPQGADLDAEPRGAHLPEALGREGVALVEGLLSPGRAASMHACITAISAQGLPAIFAYMLDAFWEPLDRLVPLVEAALGPVDVLADLWGWHIAPEPGRAGWPPHRGVYDLVRGDDGRPGLVNVWIASSSVTRATACMHVVPFARDPGYPDALSRRPFETEGAVAYEVPAGTALLWDANSIHWGGPVLPGATHARTSFSYTLRAKSLRTMDDFESIEDFRALGHIARLDLIADQLLRYGHMDPDLSDAVVDWARTLVGLRKSRRVKMG